MPINKEKMEETALALASHEDAYMPVQFCQLPEKDKQVVGLAVPSKRDGQSGLAVTPQTINPN